MVDKEVSDPKPASLSKNEKWNIKIYNMLGSPIYV